jgi:EGF-like domain
MRDCGPYVADCPRGLDPRGRNVTCSGHGSCSVGAGVCLCHAGYAGSACDVCTSDRVKLQAYGACVYLPGSQVSCNDGVKNGNEVGVDCGGPNCDACLAPKPVVPYLVIGMCIAAGIVVALILYFVRRQYRRASDKVNPVASKHLKSARKLPQSQRLGGIKPTRVAVVEGLDVMTGVGPSVPVHPQEGGWSTHQAARGTLSTSAHGPSIFDWPSLSKNLPAIVQSPTARRSTASREIPGVTKVAPIQSRKALT